MRDRVDVINCFEIPGNFLLSGLYDLLFLTIDELLDLRCFLHDAVRPIDTGDVRAKIEAEGRIHTQKSCHSDCMIGIDEQRMLLGWTAVRHYFDLRAWHGSFDARFDLLQRI